LGSILIIEEDNLKFEPKLLEQLEKDHKTFVACNIPLGGKIIYKYHIDMAIMLSKYHIKKTTKDFITSELHKICGETIPIIFVSEEVNVELNELLDDYLWWRSYTFPFNYQKIISVTNQMMRFANSFGMKRITLKKKYNPHSFYIKDISHFYRPKEKHITVHSQDPETLAKKEEDFFCKLSLDFFPKHHDIEKYFKQANQSCLVNVLHIRIVKRGKMELVLRCGTIIPTSRIYIHNFIEEEKL